jgi:putative methionine-R-sulfoxide reductase with GAF domain
MSSSDPTAHLYKFTIPKVVSADGLVCSKELDPQPYDIGLHVYHIPDDPQVRASHPMTARLEALQRIVSDLARRTQSDWLGVYRMIDGVLVKESYVGAPSRIYFPPQLYETSTNVRVGADQKTVVISDVAQHDGAYYECDGRVRSEACVCIRCPRSGRTLGIIDAESFTPGTFTADRVHMLEIAAMLLAESNLLLSV